MLLLCKPFFPNSPARDTQHPHIIRNFVIREAHDAIRPHSTSMLIDGLRIDGTTYGVYRPAFENHVYRNVHLSPLWSEPFNRGMDDARAQNGSITVDGLRMEHFRNDSQAHPLVHMTNNNLSGDAECHVRNVQVSETDPRRAIFNRGGSQRVAPFVKSDVPYDIHDDDGQGRHARLVSLKAPELMQDGREYREQNPLAGDQSRVAEVKGAEWPTLLTPVDNLPPATIITSVKSHANSITVTGVTHDNGDIQSITTNGHKAAILHSAFGVTDWTLTASATDLQTIVATATDTAGHVELTLHHLR